MYTNKTYELNLKKMEKVTGGAVAHLAYDEPEEIPIGNNNPQNDNPRGGMAHPGFGKPGGKWPDLPISGPIPPIPQSGGRRLG